MAGTSDTIFSPNMSITRGMIVTILYRLAGEPAVTGTAPFSDVASDAYYAKAVAWASNNGIVVGYGNNIFGPNDNITREQLTTILYNYVKLNGGGFEENWMFLLDMNDSDSISDWAYESVCWMSMNEIISGKPNKIFDPQGNATRAEVAAVFARFVEFLGAEEE